MPPLGWQDLLLYWSSMVLSFGGMLFSMFFPLYYREKTEFSDPQVLAVTSGKGSLLFFWLTIWMLMVFILILAGPYQQRYPIFGKTGLKYGPPAYPRVYPLLMKNKPKYWVSPKKQAARKLAFRILAAVMAVWLAFSLFMFPLSLHGRNELNRDGTLSVYNARGEEETRYRLGQISSVELDTYRLSGRSSSSRKWTAALILTTTDGEVFRFAVGTFQGDWAHTLQTMTALKDIYGHRVTIKGTEDLPKVIRDWGLSPDDMAALNRLFGVTS